MARATYQSRPTTLTAELFTREHAAGSAADLPLGVYRNQGDGSHYVVTAQQQCVKIAPGEYVADEMYADGCYPIDAETFRRRWEPAVSAPAG